MSTSPPTPPQQDVRDPYPSLAMLKELAGLAALAALAFYAVGLIVTNSYLASLGFIDYGLVKPRCVITGAWTTLVIFLCTMPSLILRRMILAPAGHELRRWKLAELLRVSGLCFLLMAALFAVLVGNPIPSPNELVNFVTFVVICGVPVLFDAWFILMARKGLPESLASRLRDARIRTTILGLVLYLGVLFLISVLFYPYVLPRWGGGKPRAAKLILNHEGTEVWSALPGNRNDYIPVTKVGNAPSGLNGDLFVTPAVAILYETDGQLIVKWRPEDGGSVVALDRKLVSAVIPTQE